jgi:signal peptidase I
MTVVEEQNHAESEAKGEEAGGSTGPRRLRRARPVSGRRRLVDWCVIIVSAVLVAVIMRSTVVQTFVIPSESMVPTLEVRDRVVVDKLTYQFREPKRGEIVVFRTPPGVDGPYNQLVKRIVGVPGDIVEARGGKVFVNGQPLKEPYLAADTVTEALPETVIPPRQYLVLGDNRGNSSDGRTFGTIGVDTLVGRAVIRAFPIARIGFP